MRYYTELYFKEKIKLCSKNEIGLFECMRRCDIRKIAMRFFRKYIVYRPSSVGIAINRRMYIGNIVYKGITYVCPDGHSMISLQSPYIFEHKNVYLRIHVRGVTLLSEINQVTYKVCIERRCGVLHYYFVIYGGSYHGKSSYYVSEELLL